MSNKYDNFDGINELYAFIKSLFEKLVDEIYECRQVYDEHLFEKIYFNGEYEPYPGARDEILREKGFDIHDGLCYPSDMTWLITCETYDDFKDFWDSKYEFPLFYLTNDINEVYGSDYVERYYVINDEHSDERIYFYIDEDCRFPKYVMDAIEKIGECCAFSE